MTSSNLLYFPLFFPVGFLAAGISTSTLLNRQCLYSPNGLYKLCLQPNGNMIGYDMTLGVTSISKFWSTGTSNIVKCTMQTDSNFACYDKYNNIAWSTGKNNTSVGPNYYLAMRNDRNIVVYDNNNALTWESKTTSLYLTSTWSRVTMPSQVVNPILLTDGTIMMIQAFGEQVYLLTPDAYGNYKKGTVKRIANLPSGYCPVYFASATLPDARIIIEGGEYNCNSEAVWTNKGAIYDPLTNQWQPVEPHPDTTNIGDASSVILPDGTFLLQEPFTKSGVALDPTTLTWTRKQFNGKLQE